MSGFGYNVQKVEDYEKFAAHYKKAGLKGSLFFAGSTPFEFMTRLADENPGSLIVVRNWPDTDQHRQMTPQQWMDRYQGQSFGKRLIIGASNECEWNQEFLDWTLELCKLAVRNDVRICIINLNSGHNTPVEWAQAKEILRIACDNPDLIYIGLHEYAGGLITSGLVGGDPTGIYDGKRIHPDYTKPENWPSYDEVRGMTRWHCGRFKFLEDYCMNEFKKVPSVILTEHGFDFLGDIAPWLNSLPRSTSSLNGWKTLVNYWKQVWPTTPAVDVLWLQLKFANENVYADSCVKVQFIFDYGPNPDWTNYRVDNAIEEKLEEYNLPVTQTFTIVPENKVYAIDVPSKNTLNFRDAPNLQGRLLKQLPSGSIVLVLSRYLQNNNNWCRINSNGIEGFISCLTNTSNVDQLKFTTLPVVDIPPPPPPPVETNFDAARAEIAKAISALQSLLLFLPATKTPTP